MTWACIPSTFLQEQAAASLETSSLDTLQSALSKSKSIPEEFCSKDNSTAFFRCFQFGMTLRHSVLPTLIPGASSSRQSQSGTDSLSAEGSRVRTSAPLARVLESTGSEADCGPSSRESLARYDRDSHSWKTVQCSLFGGLEEFSGTWPRWGMMQDGVCWGLATPARVMSGNVSGFSHPTPTSRDWKGASDGQNLDYSRWTSWLHFTFSHETRTTYPDPCLSEKVMGWPTMWTELRPLGTARFQQWLSSHGISSQVESEATA
jgi:hypothetical protein